MTAVDIAGAPDNEMDMSSEKPRVCRVQHHDDEYEGSMATVPLDSLDARAEHALVVKLDKFVIPVIMIIYLSCFLDRTNIGNVKVVGMPKDIGADAQQFSTAVSIFYVTYVLFETPLTILMKRLTPRVMLTCFCILWSTTTIASGFITNIGGLYAARMVLGLCESGLAPSLLLYLTMVYKREELARRNSYYIFCCALAGAFGGLLAYVILKMDGVAGYAGWRWVYIIEGLVSLAIAAVVWFGLPNDPNKAYFLNDKEKDMMRVRAVQRAQYMGSDEFDWEEIKIELMDLKLWIGAFIGFFLGVMLYGFATFLPSILTSMGHNSLQAQYLSIPVHLTGGFFFLACALVSDKLLVRSPFIFLANCIGMLGYILILCPTSDGVKFFSTFLCSIGAYTGVGLNLTWLFVNVAPHYRRATAVGMTLTVGNCSGIVAGQIYRTPPYVLGNAFTLACIVASQVLVAIQWAYLRRCNLQKERILSGEIPDTRRFKTGDRELDFKYHL